MTVHDFVTTNLVGMLLSIPLMAFSPATEPDLMVVHRNDHGKALVNPQMGWTMHFYSNIIGVKQVEMHGRVFSLSTAKITTEKWRQKMCARIFFCLYLSV